MDDRLKYSQLQEKHIAKEFFGYRVAGSGNGLFNGGDVLTPDWFFECKTVTAPKKSYSIKQSVIDKMQEQCFEQKRQYSTLVFRFDPKGKDYFVLDEDTFKMLYELYVKSLEERVIEEIKK